MCLLSHAGSPARCLPHPATISPFRYLAPTVPELCCFFFPTRPETSSNIDLIYFPFSVPATFLHYQAQKLFQWYATSQTDLALMSQTPGIIWSANPSAFSAMLAPLPHPATISPCSYTPPSVPQLSCFSVSTRPATLT